MFSRLLAVRGHGDGKGRLFPFNHGPPTPILGPFTRLNTQQENLITADGALQKGARVTLVPLFWKFSKTFGLFQFPPSFSLACPPSSFCKSTLLCLDAPLLLCCFPWKAELSKLVKIRRVVWVRCDAVQTRWEISNRLPRRGPQTSLLESQHNRPC